MDVKAALTGNDKLAILNSCEFGEDAALDTYRKVLKNNIDDITTQEHALISAQYLLLKIDHDRIKSLRDQLAEKK